VGRLDRPLRRQVRGIVIDSIYCYKRNCMWTSVSYELLKVCYGLHKKQLKCGVRYASIVQKYQNLMANVGIEPKTFAYTSAVKGIILWELNILL
jgi:hypothetical protein